MLDVYKNTLSYQDETIIDDNKIVWKNLRKIIQKLGEEEENYIVNENKKREKKDNRFIPNRTCEEKMNKLDLIPSLYREDEIYINTPEKGWKFRIIIACLNFQLIKTEKNKYALII